MPRPPRLQAHDGIFHLTTRGNRGASIAVDNHDRACFLELLGAVVRVCGWRCHAYCLMTNHYHLLVQTPEPTLSAGMQRLNGQYARWFNRRYGLQGHLFERRYHSVLVEGNAHLLELSRYFALNPVRAGLCPRPEHWRWSSYPAALGLAATPEFLTCDLLLGQFAEQVERARAQLAAFVDDGLVAVVTAA
ncbi:MAG: transposase [Actinobacteria bacterium]|nr:transposase [Actinomycetota bacterium]